MSQPRPGSDDCISVTTARMSAIARLTRRPATISGSADGNAILRRKSPRPNPSTCDTLISSGETDEKPWTLASRTGQIAPKAMTATDIALESPRNRIATGITADAGSGRMNSSVGSRSSRANRDVPIAAPSTMPITEASSHPTIMRKLVATSGNQSEPSASRCCSTASARSGDGKKMGEIR